MTTDDQGQTIQQTDHGTREISLDDNIKYQINLTETETPKHEFHFRMDAHGHAVPKSSLTLTNQTAKKHD